MKKILPLLIAFVLSSFTFGQSIQEIPAVDNNGDPIVNAFISYISADTNDAGQQKHDIYKLQRGQTYFINEQAVFKNPIMLIADEPGNTQDTKPPQILCTPNDQGGFPEDDWCVISTFADLTIKNIAINMLTPDGEYSWGNAINIAADGLRLELDNCYFEFVGWGMIVAYVDHTVFDINNCEVRNGTVYPDGDEWVPFFLELDTGTADSIKIRNSTFFNLQGSVVNINQQNPIGYLEFDHNTCVNVVKGFTTEINAYLTARITNNIFYNVATHGGLTADINAGGGDTVLSGIIAVDTLEGNEPGGSGGVIPEKDRDMIIRNNVYYFSQGVKDYFVQLADSITGPPQFLDSRTQSMFDDNADWPNFAEENNIEGDPGFTNFGGTDAMVAQLLNSRINGTFGFWGWDPDSSLFPSEPNWDVQHWAYMQWPQPEDFSYSASFTSTDGFHVGSLQWYPDELAQYTGPTVGVKDEGLNIPQQFSLKQNYPNPFNPATRVSFNLVKTGEVNLSVYNALGQKVRTVINNQIMSPGSHNININMSNQASGIYLLVLKQAENFKVIKMTLLK